LHQQVRLDPAQQGLDIALARAVEGDEVDRAFSQGGEQPRRRAAALARRVRQDQPTQSAGLHQAGGHLQAGIAGADDEDLGTHERLPPHPPRSPAEPPA